jgi:esterase
MPEQVVNGVRLSHEEHGWGAPIVLIHGCGGSALGFTNAIEKLSELGRVIAYDRRGCARSERPKSYERTSAAEHADDAAALLDALAATPAIVIGRSYGGTVASDLALRYPDRVRALVMLEPDAPRELAPAAAEWVDALGDRLRQVGAQAGVHAVGKALITEVAGESAWRSFPDELRRVVTDNGPAILAELEGEWWLEADAAELATIAQPALLVAAAETHRPSSMSRSKRWPTRFPTRAACWSEEATSSILRHPRYSPSSGKCSGEPGQIPRPLPRPSLD